MRPELEVPSPTPSSVLTARKLSKRYGATVALRDVSIDLLPGEIHVLLGENGAGKSTLGKIIAGITKPDSGEIFVAGKKRQVHSIASAATEAINMAFQELSLISQLTVAENLFLGREKKHFILHRKYERQDAQRFLTEIGLPWAPDTPVSTLTLPERQLLEIAKAAYSNPKILVMDEPSSRLTNKEKTKLYAVLRSLKAQGTAILYVTHHLNEVLEVGDRVSAMRGGYIAASRSVDPRMTEADLVHMLMGRESSETITRSVHEKAAKALEVESVTVAARCSNVSIDIEKGEIVGIYGVIGCGREGVANALIGLQKPDSGRITFNGEEFKPASPADAADKGVGYLPGDRADKGILALRSLIENLTVTSLEDFSRYGLLQLQKETEEGTARLSELKVKFQRGDQLITTLSGGNQQKVLFGRAIARRPALIVMEDPTAGIDIGAKTELYRLMRDLTQGGMSILLLSSDIRETISLCHRIFTMYDGRVIRAYENPTHHDEDEILADVLGRQ